MPDEHSNLNPSASARRSSGRRRGRRGGRGRSPRPPAGKVAPAEEIPTAPEPVEEAAHHAALAEPEADTSGDFREPHPEEPADVAPPEDISPSPAGSVAETAGESAAEMPPAPEPEPKRPQEPPRRPEPRRPEPPRSKPWVKPADFRPADISAISQAVAHATEIAESLKHTLDQLDEILELVELAERQKLADEREIDELRRALRRIQPPRHQQHPPRGPRHDEPHRGYKEQAPRREEPRPPRPEPQENLSSREEPPRPPEAEDPTAYTD